MPKTKILTTNFSAGELSPKVEGRTDLAQYYKGARTAKNCIIAPQGGAYKRYGMQLKAVLPSNATQYADYRLITFVNSAGSEWLIVLTNEGDILVHNNMGVLQTTITGTSYNGRNIHIVQYVSKDDVIIFTHPDIAPAKLVYDGAVEGGFYLEDISFDRIPDYTFDYGIQTSLAHKDYQLYLSDLVQGDLIQIQRTTVVDTDFNLFDVASLGYDSASRSPTTVLDPDGVSGNVYSYNVTDTDGYVRWSSVDVEPDTLYCVSGYYQLGSADTVRVLVTENNDTNVLLNIDITDQLNSDSLTRVFNTFTTASDATDVKVYFLGSGSTGTTSYCWGQLELGGLPSIYMDSINNTGTEVFNLEYDMGDAGITGGGDDATYMESVLNGLVRGEWDVEAIYEESKSGPYTYKSFMYFLFTPTSDLSTSADIQELGTTSTSGGYAYLTYKYTDKTTAGTESDAWSKYRGWPATCAFHKGRLWFGGSASLPQTIWASRSFNYFSFKIVDTDNIVDTDYINQTISSNVTTAITSMHSASRLILTTSDGSFTVYADGGTPTYKDTNITQEGNLGGKLTQMATMDNAVFYLQEGGSELNSIAYEYSSDSYVTYPNCLLSNHLINDPTRICVSIGTSEFNGESMYLLNSDGSVALFKRIEDQEVANWTSFSTDGLVMDIGSIYSDVWFIVRRTTSDGDIFTLEVMPSDTQYLDCYTHIDGLGGITELADFNVYAGNEVGVLCDGYYTTTTVSDTGLLTLPFATDDLVVGYPIEFELETMPADIETQTGHIRTQKKRINRTQLDMQDSYGFSVTYNNRTKVIGDYTTEDIFSIPEATTGIIDVRWLGWTKEDCTVRITDNRAFPVNLRSLEIEVKY